MSETETPAHPPMRAEDEDGRVAAPVINLAEIRVRRGFTAGPKCRHRQLIYSTSERRIWCEDCKSPVEGFDAFMALVESFAPMVQGARRLHDEAKEARDAVIHRIAARRVDRAWGGKVSAILCPHCRAGILPEDWASRMGTSSREYEMARRGKKPRDV